MKLPLSWAKEYIDISLDDASLQERIATQLGAIEHVEDWDRKYENILIAQITSKEDHPDADKLGVYKVNTGEQELQVVAGDKTLQVGDKVAYFPVGSVVSSTVGTADEFRISAVTLRGIESNGMMASEKELDFGGDHSKVMRLEQDAPVGQLLKEHYNLGGKIIDIENKALANRGDCFGILGLARELSGIQGNKFESPSWYLNEVGIAEDDRLPIQIENRAGGHCARYTAIVMDSVEIKQSPTWLKVKLLQSGIRPINNIVDITNYLMVLTAQPLHAFDYDKILAKDTKSKNVAKIVVRHSENGESITTLDGKTVELPEGILVIADTDNPIGIAGIMGGQSTEIDENTTRIVIECANFDRYNIRKSSMKLGIFTEAVTRFTKALDPSRCGAVLSKAVEMVGELANGKVASTVQDDWANPQIQQDIEISLERLNTHLGTKLSSEEVSNILTNIEYSVDQTSNDTLSVKVPTFRPDVQLPEDVHEDVGRQFGYNNIEVTLPQRSILPVSNNHLLQFKNLLRTTLSSNGLNEILTYNFTGKELINNSGLSIESAYHIKNSLSPQLEYMRFSLIPSLLEKVLVNSNSGHSEFGLFEINLAHSHEELDNDRLPIEKQLLTFAITSEETPIYYKGKLYTDLLLQVLKIQDVEYSLLADSTQTNLPAWIQRILVVFNKNRSGLLYLQNGSEREYLGVLGEPEQSVLGNFGLKNIVVAELDVTKLMALSNDGSSYMEPSRYPEVVQDLCFKVDVDTPYSKLEREVVLSSQIENTISKVEPLDIYQSEKEADKKQVTFRVRISNKERTLSNKDKEKIREKIIKNLEKKFDAILI